METPNPTSDEAIVTKALSSVTLFSPLVSRIDAFSSRPWFRKLRGLQRDITFDDIQNGPTGSVHKSFTHDVFRQVMQDYLTETRTKDVHCWKHIPTNSVDGQNRRNVIITPTFTEFVTLGGIFRFTLPDLMMYRWQDTEEDDNVVLLSIMKARFALTSREDVEETMGKLDGIRRQLDSLNSLSWAVREFIFASNVDMVDAAGTEMQIAVPSDCPFDDRSFLRIPVTQSQIEQTVVQMFNHKLHAKA